MNATDGRDRSPEDIADDIINQSDEGLDDLMEETEMYDESEEETPDLVDMIDDSADYDDGGDYSDF